MKILKILIMGTLALSPFFTFAYEPETTHKALTQEIIKVFNAYYPNLKIDEVERSLVESGSVAEDDGLRALHHFYDPVYNRGLAGQIPAKDWAENTIAQASIFRPLAGAITGIFGAPTDYSWDRAVYDYVWVDKSRGLDGLGHILHLIEDMSVPDHTRNDPHPPYADKMFHQASPYEHWANKWNTENIAVAEKILAAGEKPKLCGALGECFESMATYSNNNFFSKDTILSSNYIEPKIKYEREEILNNGKLITFAYNDEAIKLVARFARFIWQKPQKEDYFLTDPDEKVFTDYWSHLSKQAVLHGAGVVRLFFEAVEEERGNKRLFAKNKSLTEKLAGAMPSRLASIVGISPQPQPKPLIEEIPQSAFDIHLASRPPSAPPGSSTSDVGASLTSDVLPPGDITNLAVRQPDERPAEDPPSLRRRGSGGGEDLPFFLQLHASGGGGSPGFGGGGEVNSPASVKTPTSDIAPPVLDTTAPDISLSVSECGNSLSSDGCLLASSSISLIWSSAASDLNHYIIECEKGGAACSGFNFASTTATSTIYTLPTDDSTYIFKAKAADNAGNESSQTTKTISFSARPVVINEIAWAGTAASASDEWIELYNRSSKNVNLANWVLRANDGVPYINLSGTISTGGHYLIERTNDNAVSGTAADLIAPFSGAGSGSGLGNTSGEVLILSHASTTIDQIPNCEEDWSSCGGSVSGNKPSLERVDPDVAGTDYANWGTSNGVIKNGLDSAGAALTATPRARNSLHYLIAQGTTLTADRTLKKSFGTYIIKSNETLTVPASRTLTIEPGVTVKLGSDSKLIINGTLKAEGTASENITFTSLNSPAQHWKTVNLTSNAINSNIQYVKFEYGGRFFSNTPSEERAALSIFGNGAPVSHSTFQNSFSAGLRLTSSGSSVSANTFSVGTTTADKVGLYVSGGSPTVSGNTFSQNYTGLYITGAGNIADNVFNNNVDYPVYSLGGTASYLGNSGSVNGKNVIALTGNIATAGATTTLSANALSYLTSTPPYNNAIIPAGAGVVMGAGAKMVGENNESEFIVKGTLKLEGVSKDSIIFTSFFDSAPAQWSGILVGSTGRVYGGGFTLRYGGKGLGCPTCAGFRVEGGSVDLENAVIQNNFLAGMRFSGAATSTLDNFEFRDHQTPTGGSTALVSSNSPLTLANLTFYNNFANTSPANLY